MTGSRDPFESCLEQVRTDDHDRYLTVLHARPEDRPVLAALYAFNQEIAKTREFVSEPPLGEIRLQWWRDTIDGIYEGTPREHDVALALAAVIRKLEPVQQDFIDLIDARQFDLYDEQPQTLGELEQYAANTSGALQELAARCLGADGVAADAAGKIGTSWGLAGLMRAIPFHLRQGRVFMPKDLLDAAGLVDPSRPDATQTAALADVLDQVAARARALVGQAKASLPKPPSRMKPLILLAPLTEGYLRGMARTGYDLDRYDESRDALGRHFRLIWAGLRRGY